MNDTMAMMPMGMVFHFSSRVPGGLLFSQWRVMSVPGEVEWGGGGAAVLSVEGDECPR